MLAEIIRILTRNLSWDYSLHTIFLPEKGGNIMTCPTCHGKGVIKCERCHGHGQIVGVLSNVKCGVCGGAGMIKCPNCGGKGQIH